MRREAITPRTPIAAAVLMALMALLMAAIATPARAIVNGELANGQYPAVGVNVFQPSNGNPMFAPCGSGFLISPTAYVTAGHCAVEEQRLQDEFGGTIGVSFDPVFDPATSSFVPATSVAIHPEYLANQLSYKSPDMAVLTLAAPIQGVDPIDLPERGDAEQLPQGSQLTTVGYGLTQDCGTDLGHCQAGGFDPVRRFATETLSSVSQWFITVGQNPNANGEGGVCYGDSGGPHLVPQTNTAVALTTAIEPQFPHCWAISRDIRLDTATALEFLGPYAR